MPSHRLGAASGLAVASIELLVVHSGAVAAGIVGNTTSLTESIVPLKLANLSVRVTVRDNLKCLKRSFPNLYHLSSLTRLDHARKTQLIYLSSSLQSYW